MIPKKIKNDMDIFLQKIKNIDDNLILLFSSIPYSNGAKKYSFFASYGIYWDNFYKSAYDILQNYPKDMTGVSPEDNMNLCFLFNHHVGKLLQWRMYNFLKEYIFFTNDDNILKFYEIYSQLQELMNFATIFSPIDQTKPYFINFVCYSLQSFSMFDDVGVFFYSAVLLHQVIRSILKISEPSILKEKFINKVKEKQRTLFLIKDSIKK